MTREIEGTPYFNHTYVLIYGSNARRFRAEGGELAGMLDFAVNLGGDDSSPFIDDPIFSDLWEKGAIEGVATTEVDDDGRLENLLQVRGVPKLYSSYTLTPTEPDEGNCHTVCNVALETLGLSWPRAFDDIQHHGRYHKNTEFAKIVEPKADPIESEERTPSNNGLNE